MRQSFAERHGYKGIETAYNGLISWLDKNHPVRGNDQQRRNHYSRQIVEFAAKNIEGFVNKGHLDTKADRAAKLIDKRKLFQQFVQYFNTHNS